MLYKIKKGTPRVGYMCDLLWEVFRKNPEITFNVTHEHKQKLHSLLYIVGRSSVPEGQTYALSSDEFFIVNFEKLEPVFDYVGYFDAL